MQSRFFLYHDSIRELCLNGPHTGREPNRIDLRRWFTQYPKATSMVLLRSPCEPNDRVCAHEAFTFAGRIIPVHGTVRYSLPMTESAFGPEADQDIVWLGRHSIDGVGAPQEEQDLLFGDFYRVIDPSINPSSLQQPTLGTSILVSLAFPGVEMSMKVLDNILAVCPRLKRISCILTCHWPEPEDYLTRLTDLVRGPGAGLETIGPCIVKGANLLMFARHLAFAPEVFLEGVIDGDCIDSVVWLPWLTGSRPGQMVLKPQPIAREGQHVDETINPYELAKVIRRVLGFSKVYIQQATEGTSTDATVMWTRILSSIWKSFEKEDEMRCTFDDFKISEDWDIDRCTEDPKPNFWDDEEDESMLKDFWDAQEQAPVAEAFAGANGDEGTPV
jgi:hypothetical protein